MREGVMMTTLTEIEEQAERCFRRRWHEGPDCGHDDIRACFFYLCESVRDHRARSAQPTPGIARLAAEYAETYHAWKTGHEGYDPDAKLDALLSAVSRLAAGARDAGEARDRFRDGMDAAARLCAMNGIDVREYLHLSPGGEQEVYDILASREKPAASPATERTAELLGGVVEHPSVPEGEAYLVGSIEGESGERRLVAARATNIGTAAPSPSRETVPPCGACGSVRSDCLHRRPPSREPEP